MAPGEETGAMAGEPEPQSASMADPGLVLVFARDLDVVPSVVLLEQGTTVIGREPPPGGVALPLSSVSRVHARVVCKGDQTIVHDLRSRNGVFVRGRRVRDSIVLVPGDEVRIGDAMFVYVTEETKSTSSSTLKSTTTTTPTSTPQGLTRFPCGSVS